MQLVLKLAPPWGKVDAADGEALAFMRTDVPARVHTTPLYDRLAPPRRAARADESVVVVGETEARSALGWPVHVVERVVTPQGAPRRELEVRYAFFELGGSAIVSGPADAIAHHRDELLAAALEGRPDFHDQPVCLAELFEGID